MARRPGRTAPPGWCTGRVGEPLIFRPGAAAVAFNIAVAVWVLFELVMRVRQGRRAGSPAARDPTVVILSACLVGAVVAAEQLGRRGPLRWPGGLVWPVAAGITLMAAGVGLRAWSIATLGRFFQY